MGNQKKFAVLLIIFLFILAGAMFAYRYLSENYMPDNAAGGLLSNQNSDTNGSDTIPSGIESADAGNTDTTAGEVLAAWDFTVYDYDGNEVQLSDFYGKPILINFWATWCPPCKKELPDFDAVYKEYGEDVTFMMVNLTDGARDTVEGAAEFVEDNGYAFPVYYDKELDGANTYGAYSIPMTVLIDADANIVGAQVGTLTDDQLRLILDSVLADK